jgi:hypothetical protein
VLLKIKEQPKPREDLIKLVDSQYRGIKLVNFLKEQIEDFQDEEYEDA